MVVYDFSLEFQKLRPSLSLFFRVDPEFWGRNICTRGGLGGVLCSDLRVDVWHRFLKFKSGRTSSGEGRKNSSYSSRGFSLPFQLLLLLEDRADWNSSKERESFSISTASPLELLPLYFALLLLLIWAAAPPTCAAFLFLCLYAHFIWKGTTSSATFLSVTWWKIEMDGKTTFARPARLSLSVLTMTVQRRAVWGRWFLFLKPGVCPSRNRHWLYFYKQQQKNELNRFK